MTVVSFNSHKPVLSHWRVSVFLLFIGGLILLCVLSGIALLSVLGSLFFNAIYVTTSNILSCYYPQLTKVKYCRLCSSYFIIYNMLCPGIVSSKMVINVSTFILLLVTLYHKELLIV